MLVRKFTVSGDRKLTYFLLAQCKEDYIKCFKEIDCRHDFCSSILCGGRGGCSFGGEIMSQVIVFGGNNSLDFSDIRYRVLRIPEVSMIIEEAQEIWDKATDREFTFHQFLSAEDLVFYRNPLLKSLSLSIVQLGLFKRFLRLNSNPEFLVGNLKSNGPISVAAGLKSLNDLVLSSEALQVPRPLSMIRSVDEITLQGQALPEFQTFAKSINSSMDSEQSQKIFYSPILKASYNVTAQLTHLIENKSVRKIVHIGPGAIDKSTLFSDYNLHDVQITESIDMDAHLAWFWQNMKEASA